MGENATIIFGDVHGDATRLRRLIDDGRAKYGPDAEFISLGDLIDRGPNSREVIDICVTEKVTGIRGNHDLWFVDVLAGKRLDEFAYAPIMGGISTLRSYGVSRGDPDVTGPQLRRVVPKEHRDWVFSTVPHIVLRSNNTIYLLTHTGITQDALDQVLGRLRLPTTSLPEVSRLADAVLKHSPDAFFWAGAKPGKAGGVGRIAGVVQVFGHTPYQQPIVESHFVALDTGCGTCPPRALSALVLREGHEPEILQAL